MTRFVCKGCGAESPAGIGYAVAAEGPLPFPDPWCKGRHAPRAWAPVADAAELAAGTVIETGPSVWRIVTAAREATDPRAADMGAVRVDVLTWEQRRPSVVTWWPNGRPWRVVPPDVSRVCPSCGDDVRVAVIAGDTYCRCTGCDWRD